MKATKVDAISIEATRFAMDQIDALMPTYTRLCGDDIHIDTRGLDEEDSLLDQVAEILDTPRGDLAEKIVVIHA